MKTNDYLLLIATGAYSFLFYQQNAGINFLIFNIVLLAILVIKNKKLLSYNKWLWSASLCLISAGCIFFHSSALSIIGNIFSFISAIWAFLGAKKSYEMMLESTRQMEDAPDWMRSLMGPEMLELSLKMYENRLPILLIGLMGSLLCLWGAMEMRKLKKQGYPIWLAGEILPIIGMGIIIGKASFSGLAAVSLLFPAVFIILFTAYRKELTD